MDIISGYETLKVSDGTTMRMSVARPSIPLQVLGIKLRPYKGLGETAAHLGHSKSAAWRCSAGLVRAYR